MLSVNGRRRVPYPPTRISARAPLPPATFGDPHIVASVFVIVVVVLVLVLGHVTDSATKWKTLLSLYVNN